MTSPAAPVPKPTWTSLTLLFLRVGNLTFGGGDPTMVVLQRELVEQRRWITPEQYAIAYALARITPGTNILAFSAAVASVIKGWRGAVLVVLAITIPSAVLVIWITLFYEYATSNRLANGALEGLVAGAVGMMASGIWLLMKPHIGHGHRLRMVALVTGAFLLLYFEWMAPIWILVLAALAGWLWPGKEAA